MIFVRDRAGVFAFEDFFHASLYRLEGFVVAARGKRIALLSVFFFVFRIPRSGSHTLDQIPSDSITFDRQ